MNHVLKKPVFLALALVLPMSALAQLVKDGAAANIAGAQASNVYFGTYRQTSDGADGFNVDPIKWRVLQNNTTDQRLFLLADQNLDAVQYHEDDESVTWEYSTIRAWLEPMLASGRQMSLTG